MAYHHGITLTETAEGVRSIRDAKSAVIGMVCTADDADDAVFPLNTAVLIPGDVGYLTKAGSTGTHYKTLDAIFDQAKPMIVVVRVGEGADEAEQNTLIIGDASGGSFTGMQALRNAKMSLDIRPRILGVPEMDTAAVAAELITVADELRGFAYISAYAATTKEEAVTYRETFGAKRAMVIWPEFVGWDVATSAEVELNAVARALGMRAKLDHDIGWHKTISNMPVGGVTGTSKDIWWDLRSPNTTAGYLNENEVTTIIREQGIRFWGSRTCSEDPNEAFESAIRTGDILGDTIADSHLWAIDKPMSRALIFDLVEGINAKLRELKSLGRIIDGKAWVNEELNTVTSLAEGKLYVDYDYVPAPPLENLLLTQRLNNTYLIQLVS